MHILLLKYVNKNQCDKNNLELLMLMNFSLSNFSLNKLNCSLNDGEVWIMLMKDMNSKDNLIIHR
ncbi:hypothetical protein CQK57_21490 [Salmonella enterica]|uniref:Uncharacterized protein n=2 Tax=Salmonella enterica I TaxID=59201 RepID=A0A5X7K7S8_SALET|nr:hypothetical protein [Salmonella enterica]EBG8070691.1 hypothetical protein [Salmonella enterica subsp. enterica serovar Elisabethville]EBU7169596.1 hypothetical protein [Salmonella enterica subsp. enterica serovar Stockholm]ECA1252833.1 hypothetical protein [Salmonella enterica subsp. enterica serovar Chailey]ECA7542799.1 hypothetical protein [Salmonella enterica subsp. enterica serovar Strasbourg]ECB0591265.1 hypothetical protein [Salmonella enterica subsp. enterica serovar Bareilly]ECB0